MSLRLSRAVVRSTSILQRSLVNQCQKVFLSHQLQNKSLSTQTHSIRTFSSSSTPSAPEKTASITNSNAKTEEKKKRKLFGGIFSKYKRYWFALIALGVVYWRFTVSRREAATAAALKMVCISEKTAEKFLDILMMDEDDFDEIMSTVLRRAHRGMVDVEQLSITVYNQVEKRRAVRKVKRQELQAERERIEAEVRAEAEGVEVAHIESASPAPAPAAAPTPSSWLGWIWGSSKSAEAPAASEPSLATLEMAFDDWLDDADSDNANIYPFDPMILFSQLPYGTIGNKYYVHVADVAVALSLVTNVYTTPASPRHNLAIPTDTLKRAQIDMEALWTAYREAMETRTGPLEYLDVITGKRFDMDRCLERTERVMRAANCGDWTALSTEEQSRLARRLNFVYRRSQLSYHYRKALDTRPERRIALAWRVGGSEFLQREQLTTLVRRMLTAGHYHETALIEGSGYWPVKFKTTSAAALVDHYYTSLGKDASESFSLNELIEVMRRDGILNSHYAWYMDPENYTSITNFQAYRLKKRSELFGVPAEVQPW